MSVALYIVAEREIAGFDPFVNGKSVGHESERAIGKFCLAAGVHSLLDFCSHDPDELAGFIESEGGEVPDELPEQQWFGAAEGLRVVRAMLRELRKGESGLRDPEGVSADLKEYETVLERLEAEEVRWNLAADF